jgi:hypothetical protein
MLQSPMSSSVSIIGSLRRSAPLTESCTSWCCANSHARYRGDLHSVNVDLKITRVSALEGPERPTTAWKVLQLRPRPPYSIDSFLSHPPTLTATLLG